MKTSWTLFLDRDGVINQHPETHYVMDWSGFKFAPGAIEGIINFSDIFSKIIIVTNQQGVGKGLMTVQQVQQIHNKMKDVIQVMGGRIDHITFCPDLVSNPDHQRKPRSGMALEAKALFPEIDFHQSVMIGDQKTDMEFGRNLGMKCIHIQNNESHHTFVESPLYDLAFKTLHLCSTHLKSNYEQFLRT